MNEIVQKALDARKKRKEQETQGANGNDKVANALKQREEQKKASLPNKVKDWETRLQTEVDSFNGYVKQGLSFGKNTYKDAVTATNANRTNLSSLKKEVESYRKYLGDKETDEFISYIYRLMGSYESYLKSAEGYSQFESEDDYNAYLDYQKELEVKKNLNLEEYAAETKAMEDTFNSNEDRIYKYGTRKLSKDEWVSQGNEDQDRLVDSIETYLTQMITYANAGAEGNFNNIKPYYDKAVEKWNLLYGKLPDFLSYDAYRELKDNHPNLKEEIASRKAYFAEAEYLQLGDGMNKEYAEWDAIEGNDISNLYNLDAIKELAWGDEAYQRASNIQGAINGMEIWKYTPEGSEYKKYKDMYAQYVGWWNEYHGDVLPWQDGLDKFTKNAPAMESNEIETYLYFLNTQGVEKANEYLYSLEAIINQRSGAAIANAWDDNWFTRTLFAIGSGINSWAEGIHSSIESLTDSGDYKYDPYSSMEYASGMVREAMETDFGKGVYDVMNSIGNMAPSIALSFVPVVGTGLSLASTFASSGGNAYKQMRREGYSADQARLYGALVGGSEAGLQYVLGGISKLGGKAVGKLTGKAIAGVDSAFARVAIKVGSNMVAEGLEEGLQTVLEPWFKSIATGVDFDAPDIADVLYSSLLGAVTSFLMEGGSTAINTGIESHINKKTYGSMQSDLVAQGLTLEEGTAGRLRAEKYQKRLDSGKNLTGTQLGILAESNQQGIKTEDVAKIQKAVENRLTELGETGDVPEIAEIVAKQTAGEKLSLYEKAVLKKSKYGTRVINELNTENIASGEYSTGWTEGIGTDNINATAYNLMAEDIANARDAMAKQKEDYQQSIDVANLTAQQQLLVSPTNGLKAKDVYSTDASIRRGIGEDAKQFFKNAKFDEKGNLIKKGETASQTAEAPQAVNSPTNTETKAESKNSPSNKGKKTHQGEEVIIQRVTGIKDGEVTVLLNNGNEVNVNEVEFDSRDESIMYAMAAEAGMNVDTANAFIHSFDNGILRADGKAPISLEMYAQGFVDAYRYGQYGIPESELSKGQFTSELNPHQTKIAYERGKADGVTSKRSTAPLTKNTQDVNQTVNQTHAEYKGETFANDVDENTLDEMQKDGVTSLKLLYEALGLKGYFFESDVDESGKRIGKNGYYNPEDGSIHVDLYAGQNGEKTILFTASHELTHFIRQWSPSKFKVFADVLLKKLAEKDANIEELIQEKIKNNKAKGRWKGKTDTEIYDLAYEEVVADACETMLSDGNAFQRIAAEIKAKDQSLWAKIKNFFTKLINKLKAVYAKCTPNSKEGKLVREMGDAVQEVHDLWTDALIDASSNYQAWTRENATLETDAVSVSEDGQVMLQMRQYEETGRNTLREYLVKQYGEADADNLMSTIDNIYDVMAEIKQDKSLSVFGNWQETEVELDAEGHPIFTTSIKNGDYELNQDFSRVCKKRRQLDFVLNMLAEDPSFEASHLTKQDFVKINNAIKEHGFEIACALCFVDSKRFRQAEWADSFANTWNDILNAVVKDKSKLTPFNFATSNPNLSDDGIEIDTSRPVMYRKWENGKEDVAERRNYDSFDQMFQSELDKKGKPKYLEGNANVRTIATLIRDNPELRHTFRGADIIASQGFDTMQRLAPAIRNILDGWGGSSVPKPSSNDASYDSSIINLQSYNKEKAYAMGGARMNSFSDFMAHMFFDYCQAFADLSAKELPSQAYTKELDYVRFFGRSGQKQNMSGIPAIRKNSLQLSGYTTKAKLTANDKVEMMIAGLDVTRLLEHLNKDIMELTESDVEQFLDMCDYVWADESINMKHATLLQTGILYDKLSDSKIEECYELLKAGEIEQALKVAGEENVDREYAKHCGTIVVGVSDAHIRKLLRDPTIRMVIPYHKSGLNPNIAKELRISVYNDYTDVQNTGAIKKGETKRYGLTSDAIKSYGLKDFSFYDWFGKTIDGKLYDGKATAEKYIEWCKKGYYDETVGDYVYYTTKKEGYILAKDLHQDLRLVPKFDAFVGEENYYKVLEDFDCYNTITGEHSPQGAVDFLRKGLPSDYKDVLVKALKKEQQTADDFRDHLDNKGLKDEIMGIVKKNGYNPSSESDFMNSDRDSEGNTLTAEQQEFFKDSKIRDENGNLLVVYHGTANGGFFPLFEGDKLDNTTRTSQIGQGFYFTNAKIVAQDYTKNQDIYTGRLSAGKNPYLFETYLNITNPFDVNKDNLDVDKAKAVFMDGTREWFFNNHIPSQLDGETINGQVYSKETIQGMSKEEKVSLYVDSLVPLGSKEVLSNMVRAFSYGKQGELLASMKKRLGYDGIVEEFKKGVYQYVAFDSNQIKLTSNKTPTSDPDIRFSDRVSNKELAEMDDTALYIKNTKNANYIGMIFNGTKTEETRSTRTLDAFIGKDFYVTDGKYVYGSIVMGEPHKYTEAEFHKLENQKKHRVPKGDEYDIKKGGIKWAYPIESYNKFDKPKKLSDSKEYKNSFQAREVLYDDGNTVVNEGQVLYSDRVTDKETLDFLNEQLSRGEVTKVYRAMQVQPVDENGNVIRASVIRVVSQSPLMVEAKTFGKNGKVATYPAKLFSPMAGMVNGKWSKSIDLNEWEETTFDLEHAYTVTDKATGKPKIDNDKKNASYGEVAYYYGLVKGGIDDSGKKLTDVPARYNPYIHTSLSALNDQFSSANKRPELVTVECIVPNSELTSGFRAEGAKDSVGAMKWHSGPTSSRLAHVGKARTVILTRYDMPIRVVPDSEVAKAVADYIGDSENIAIKGSTVTPSLSRELMNLGISVLNQQQWKEYDKKFPVETFGDKNNSDIRYSDRGNGYEYYKKTVEFNAKYQKGVANKDNYYYNTIAEFKPMKNRPSRKPDFTSRESEYWYTDKGVIRGSNHWGRGVASCDWYYDGDYPNGVVTTEKVYGYCAWKDFTLKVDPVITPNGKTIIPTFENSKGKGFTFDEDGRLYQTQGYNSREIQYQEENGEYYGKDGNKLWQLRDDSMAEQQGKVAEVLEAENAQLKEDNQNLRDLLKLQRQLTHGTKFTKTSVEAMATRLMKYANAKGDKAEFVGILNRFYEYIASEKDLSWEGIAEKAQPAIKWLQKHFTAPKTEIREENREILKMIKDAPIYLNDLQQKETAYYYGSFYEYRKKAMGSLSVVNKNNPNAISLDSMWHAWSEQYPYYFDAELNTNEQPMRLLEIVKTLRNPVNNQYEYDYSDEMVAQDLLSQVYDSYWGVSTLHTVADSMQKKINELKGKHNQQLSKVREFHNEKHEQLKKEYQEKLKKQREEYRERGAKAVRELMDRAAESRRKGVERRNMTELRGDIKKVVSELNNLLLHGTKERNIKFGLQEAVADALEAINLDSVDAENRIAKLQEDLLKAKTPEEIEKIQHSIDFIRNQGDNFADKLEKLRKAYSEIRNNANKDFPSQFKEEAQLIHDRIEMVIQDVGNTPLRNMTLAQLQEVYDMYKMVLTTIRLANNIWRENKLIDLQGDASTIMQDFGGIKPLKTEELAVKSKVREFSWNEMTPYCAFQRIGSDTFAEYYQDFVKAQNVYARDGEEAKEFATSTREKYDYRKWKLDKVYEFKLKDGRTFKTTLKHMLSIYAYSKRDQALKHMKDGGFFYNDKSTFRKGKGGILEFIARNEAGYKIDEDILAEIKDSLTSEQIGYVDEMQEYLTKMGEKGNEVTRVMWGIDVFKEKVYFPLKSKEDFIKRSTETAQNVSLKNDGMTKETKPNASNPIILEAFDEVWANHVERMCQYHAFVIPIDNLNKVLNYGTWAGTDSMAVSTMITARHGSEAKEYIKQFINDMNGGVTNQGAKNPFEKWVGRFKKTAVGLSLSTIVQQPTAILRAFAVVDAKYFVGKPDIRTLGNKWSEVKKYAPIALIKEIGGFDAGGGKSMARWLNKDTLKGKDKVMDTIDDISMKGAEIADKLGWVTIWNAVKREVKANNPQMDVNSDAFLEKCGERFTDVIVQTQVYDSTLSRSGYMRSKNSIVKMATAFMGEPTLSFNMVANAIRQVARGKMSKAKAIRVISSVFLSQVAASAMASFIYALNDDDEDESYWEKYMQAFGGEFISDIVFAPVTSLPFVKDIVSIFQGWDVERTDMAMLQDIKDAIDGLFSENKSIYRKIEDFVGAFGNFFGVPAKNLLRTGRQAYNLFEDIFDGIEGGDMGDAFIEGATDYSIPFVDKVDTSKSEKLYEAYVNGDNARLEVYRKNYKTEEAYNTALRKALRENDPRIRQAAQARLDGDISEYARIAKEIIAEGKFNQDNVVGAINSEINAIKKGEEENTVKPDDGKEEATSIYSASDISSAFDNGDTALGKQIIKELIRVKVANGMTEKEAKSSLRSSMTSHWKSIYIEAYKRGDKYEQVRIRKILYSSGLYGTVSDVVETCNGWVTKK